MDKHKRFYIKHKARRNLNQKNVNLKKSYGITLLDYNKLVEAQAGLCAICKNPPKGKTPRTLVLHVDHNHSTGNNRELLCWSCNVGLGMFGDNPDLCETAAAYLRRHNG